MPLYRFHAVSPTLGRNVFVADSATVIGDVQLGDEASVWFGAVLRGDYYPIRVGARTNIQDNAVLHITRDSAATTLGDDVTVGHGAIIHGCTIGNRCLIGMGSVILDAANLGDDSFVAAGSLITPRTVFPPRSFVRGRPAKFVRAVNDEDLTWIHGSATSYVAYASEFRRACSRID